jgi:hypothetical protein
MAVSTPTYELSRPLVPSRVALARNVFLGASWAYVGMVVIQVALAGMALMGPGLSIRFHLEFAHLFGLVGIVQLISVLGARLPRSFLWLTLGLGGLLLFQGALILLRPIVPIAPAFHPVNALFIGLTALTIARRATTAIRGR